MAVTPINFNRVSHNLKTMSLLDSLRKNTMDLFTEQTKLATGRKLTAPSDDPVLAGRALDLTEVLDRQDQLLANIQHADSFLSATDNATSEISDLLNQAKSIASSMVNTVVSADERASQAEIVASIIDELILVGNRTFAGTQLFAGKDVQAAPFSRDYGGILFKGDTSSLSTDVGQADNLIYNLTGDVLYGATTGRVVGYQDLEPAPEADTRLKDLDGATGLGVRLGSITIVENGGALTYNVDLSKAATVGDIVDAINDAAVQNGGATTAAIIGSGLELGTGGVSLEVREVGNGTTADDLGIKGSDAGGLISGSNLHAHLVDTTRVTAFVGGAGVTLADPIHITNGTLSADVDLSGAQTVQDILNALNTAGVGIKAAINEDGNGINITNLVSGTELRISELGGTTADQLGILTLHSDQPLSELNHGDGLRTVSGKTDIQIVAKDGTTYDIDLSAATTVQDVLDTINLATGGAVVADLNPNGAGIRLTDTTGGGGDLKVNRLNGSFAIEDLGFDGLVASGATTELISNDPAGVQASSVFTALLALEQGLRQDDTQLINEAAQDLETFIPEITRIRGIVGARAQSAHERATFTEDAVQATRVMLSDVQDLDYTEAVTKFQQAQTALQANLLTGSRMLQISLLDFLG